MQCKFSKGKIICFKFAEIENVNNGFDNQTESQKL